MAEILSELKIYKLQKYNRPGPYIKYKMRNYLYGFSKCKVNLHSLILSPYSVGKIIY